MQKAVVALHEISVIVVRAGEVPNRRYGISSACYCGCLAQFHIVGGQELDLGVAFCAVGERGGVVPGCETEGGIE